MGVCMGVYMGVCVCVHACVHLFRSTAGKTKHDPHNEPVSLVPLDLRRAWSREQKERQREREKEEERERRREEEGEREATRNWKNRTHGMGAPFGGGSEKSKVTLSCTHSRERRAGRGGTRGLARPADRREMLVSVLCMCLCVSVCVCVCVCVCLCVCCRRHSTRMQTISTAHVDTHAPHDGRAEVPEAHARVLANAHKAIALVLPVRFSFDTRDHEANDSEAANYQHNQERWTETQTAIKRTQESGRDRTQRQRPSTCGPGSARQPRDYAPTTP
jgi:hypothetical protein